MSARPRNKCKSYACACSGDCYTEDALGQTWTKFDPILRSDGSVYAYSVVTTVYDGSVYKCEEKVYWDTKNHET